MTPSSCTPEAQETGLSIPAYVPKQVGILLHNGGEEERASDWGAAMR